MDRTRWLTNTPPPGPCRGAGPAARRRETTRRRGILRSQLKTVLGTPNDAVVLIQPGGQQATATRILSDAQARISRVIRGTFDQVWRAHHKPELLQRWLLGPDGWTMPACEVATTVGEKYRYE